MAVVSVETGPIVGRVEVDVCDPFFMFSSVTTRELVGCAKRDRAHRKSYIAVKPKPFFYRRPSQISLLSVPKVVVSTGSIAANVQLQGLERYLCFGAQSRG